MPAKILVVDDSPDVLLLCRVHLEYEGYEVLTADDGIRALKKVEEEHPDLILLDVMMPVVDGWEVLSTVKKNPETRAIQVVMLTARGAGMDEMRGWREGASGYVTKPFNPATLSSVVREALVQTPVEADQRRREMLQMLQVDQRLTDDAVQHHSAVNDG